MGEAQLIRNTTHIVNLFILAIYECYATMDRTSTQDYYEEKFAKQTDAVRSATLGSNNDAAYSVPSKMVLTHKNTFSSLCTVASVNEDDGPCRTTRIERKRNKQLRKLQRLESRVEAGEKLNPEQEVSLIKLRMKYPPVEHATLPTPPSKRKVKQNKKRIIQEDNRQRRREEKQIRRRRRQEEKQIRRRRRQEEEEEENRRRRRQQEDDDRRRRRQEEDDDRRRRRQEEEEDNRRRRRGQVNSMWDSIPPEALESIKRCQTEKQLNRYRRSAMRKYHPDRGGNLEVSQAFNNCIDICIQNLRLY